MVETLLGARPTGHLVQLYASDGFLGTAVARYVGAALAAGESAVVVATPSHWVGIRQELEQRGVDVSAAVDSGRVRPLDAAETLARLLEDGAPSARAFEAVIAPVLDAARSAGKVPRVRAFGEMVDLLWERGAYRQADQLEGLWDRAMQESPFTLLCSYRADVFDPTMPTSAVEAVLASHSSVAVEDRGSVAARFDLAVDEVLGVSQAAMLRVVVAAAHPHDAYAKAPVEHRMLWLRTHMPRIAERVLAAMQESATLAPLVSG